MYSLNLIFRKNQILRLVACLFYIYLFLSCLDGLFIYFVYTCICFLFVRFRLKGIRHLVFYQLPTYPEFYSEILNFVDQRDDHELSSPTCHVLYTTFDQQALARVVGSARGKHMVESDKNVHMLVSEK